jgi:hypothetical protein
MVVDWLSFIILTVRAGPHVSMIAAGYRFPALNRGADQAADRPKAERPQKGGHRNLGTGQSFADSGMSFVGAAKLKLRP